MRKFFSSIFIVSAAITAAEGQATNHLPRHRYSLKGGLTAPRSGPPREIARSYMRSHAAELGLTDADLSGLHLVKEFRSEHNGVTHLRYRQRFQGIDVERSSYVVNIDREGRVINSGGSLYSAPQNVRPPSESSAPDAVREAVKAVNPKLAVNFRPARKLSRNSVLTFERGPLGEDAESRAVWHPVRGKLRPAWKVRVTEPEGMQSWSVVVESESSQVLSKESLTWYFQSEPKGLVFERESPQPNLQPGTRLTAAPALSLRSERSFKGDPAVSPRGWISDNQTRGNNVVAGTNASGTPLLPDPPLVSGPGLNFSFPLELGRGSASPWNYPEAAVTNLFYWANRAHDWFYEVGFDEQAGNYQQNNFGKGGEEGDAMYAYAHFGIRQSGQAPYRNAFFDTRELGDGRQSGVHMFLSLGRDADGNVVELDGAYASDVILHEYTENDSSAALAGCASSFGRSAECFRQPRRRVHHVPLGHADDGIAAKPCKHGRHSLQGRPHQVPLWSGE